VVDDTGHHNANPLSGKATPRNASRYGDRGGSIGRDLNVELYREPKAI